MGNLTSCYLVQSESGSAKLIDLEGNLQSSIELPMTAAELMLEKPGHFVSAVDELQSTSRFSAMKAEDQLSSGKVYVLVPVVRLHSKLSESDMIIVESSCKKKRRSRRHRSKILPAPSVEGGTSEMPDSQVLVSTRDNNMCPYASPRVRQWIPSLDSISEV